MTDTAPTVYTEQGSCDADADRVVAVRLPADVADELMVTTLWLSIQLGHRVPLNVLRRALVVNGLDSAAQVLSHYARHGD